MLHEFNTEEKGIFGVKALRQYMCSSGLALTLSSFRENEHL